MQTNHRILIVDDTRENVRLLRTILEDDYVLESAATGEEALEILPKFRPDLILLDIKMPGIDGYEVCRRIKKDEQYDFIKIILVSALAMIEERLKGYEAGADDYVTKPFDQDELEAKIRVFLKLKRSEEIDQLKTDLLTLFSHEMRTPLNAIMGMSTLMLEDELDDEIRENINIISAGGRQLLAFFEKTMILCELKSKPSLDKSSGSLRHYLTDVIILLENAAAKRNIEIEASRMDDVLINADWGKLTNVFDYVIENAVKYSPDGGKVDVRLENLDHAVEIIVSDHGQGIPAEWIDNIFDEFAVKDIVHHQKGQGLSLAISKHTMELHGGTIKARSIENKETTFTLSLPLKYNG